jgi:hypothetical protein
VTKACRDLSNPLLSKCCEGRKWISKALVGKEQDRNPRGRAPGIGSARGQAPTKQASWNRACMVKPKRINNKSQVGTTYGGHHLGVYPVDAVTRSGLVLLGTKTLQGSPGPSQACIIYSVPQYHMEVSPTQ